MIGRNMLLIESAMFLYLLLSLELLPLLNEVSKVVSAPIFSTLILQSAVSVECASECGLRLFLYKLIRL